LFEAEVSFCLTIFNAESWLALNPPVCWKILLDTGWGPIEIARPPSLALASGSQSESTVRFYFDLIGADEVLRDEEGVEASDLAELRQEVISAIDEVRQRDDQMNRWADWKMHIFDERRSLVWIVALGGDVSEADLALPDGGVSLGFFLH
jgi:hypothetical protein